MNATVIKLPGVRDVPAGTPKSVVSKMDTVLITQKFVDELKTPPFQRQKRVNAKILGLVEEMQQSGGIVPGIITIGNFDGDKYIVDGQHRLEAFRMSQLAEGIMDARICAFASMAEMADEFVKLNSALVRMKNDDILRGMESGSPGLKAFHKRCPFFGYSHIRANASSPIAFMSSMLRCWFMAQKDVPASGGASTTQIIEQLNEDEAEAAAKFYGTAFDAWDRDDENRRLWATLNITICAWLWMRTVVRPVGKVTRLTRDQFRVCMTALSASRPYQEFLHARMLSERDRGPCYKRVKQIFAKRLADEGLPKAVFPSPDWDSGGGRKLDL